MLNKPVLVGVWALGHDYLLMFNMRGVFVIAVLVALLVAGVQKWLTKTKRAISA